MALKIIQSMYRYFKKIGDNVHISAWKSKGSSDESIKLPDTSDNMLALSLNYITVKPRTKFDGQCWKQDKAPFTHKSLVNAYIVY